MPVITYNPEDNKYDVPAGTYLCRFKGTRDKPPFKESKFGDSNEPRLGWEFEIIGPPGSPSIGKIIEQPTGTYPSPKSGLVRLLNMMLARPLQPGEQIDPDHLRGRVYQVLWTVNPRSETGGLYVGSMMAADATNVSPAAAPPGSHLPWPKAHQHMNQVPPAPPPPPPPPRSAIPPAPPPPAPANGEPSYWVETPQGVRQMTASDLKAYLDMTPGAADTPVMAGDQQGGWKTAADFGVKPEMRF